MDTINCIVQASSKNWSGSKDICMNTIKGYPVVYWVIKKILGQIPSAQIVLVAPLFDKEGVLDNVINELNSDRISAFFGYDSDPLNRICVATDNLNDDDYIIRIDGLNYFVDLDMSLNMLQQAKLNNLDCVKFPDAWPVQFTSDIYRVGALREVNGMLFREEDQIYRVHPKYYLFNHSAFNCKYAEEIPNYGNDYLVDCRATLHEIYSEERTEVDKNRIWVGCQLSFHYELAVGYIKNWMKVLDIACGYGYGTKMLAKHCSEIYGADIDRNIIEYNRKNNGSSNIKYHVEDVTTLSYDDNEFDAVTSMETLEHVDAPKYFEELYRVLKPGGILILSTPQNLFGRIPITSVHVREYSMTELEELCKNYFTIKKFIGIKQGRIVFPNDPYGNNSMVVCRKA